MSARDDLINEYGQAHTAPLGTLADLRRKLDAYRAEVLAEGADKLALELAPEQPGAGPGFLLALRLAVRAMRRMADTTAAAATATPDFFEVGHTYTTGPRSFRCFATATHPAIGEIRAIGWYATSPGAWPSAEALDPDDFTHMGWTDITNNTTTGDPA